MNIRRLPEGLINVIAAGEVIERPAAVVKELVENALDAGAMRIKIHLEDGGKSKISVVDDGSGLTRSDLFLAFERHATSKLDSDHLDSIRTLGFRGEALPSIAAVSRICFESRASYSEDPAWIVSYHGGVLFEDKPGTLQKGTIVTVRDLFYATPARLKFLRSERAEREAVVDHVKRLALAHPSVAFGLYSGGKKNFRLSQSPCLRFAGFFAGG